MRFDNTILVLIVLSSFGLAIDNPLFNPDSELVGGMIVFDYIMTSLFTCELVCKVIAQGVFLRGPPKLHPRGRVSVKSNKVLVLEREVPYLRTSWGVLDATVVTVSVFSLAAAGNPELQSLRAVRTLRVLRPLRMISRNKGMRLVVNRCGPLAEP